MYSSGSSGMQWLGDAKASRRRSLHRDPAVTQITPTRATLQLNGRYETQLLRLDGGPIVSSPASSHDC